LQPPTQQQLAAQAAPPMRGGSDGVGDGAGAAAPAAATMPPPASGPTPVHHHHHCGVTLGLVSAPPAPLGMSDERMMKRVADLEQQLAETQALLYAQAAGAQASVAMGAAIGGAGGGVGAPGAFLSGGVNGPKLDATGAFCMPVAAPEGAGGGYGHVGAGQHTMLSPRLLRKKAPGGAHAVTSSYHAATASGRIGGNVGAGEGGECAGPPFRSQAERRQWLLQEKRRWLVEMRLGAAEQATGAIQAPTPSKLPPIGPGGAMLSNGMDVAALVTPR
jgi:hypothetical protein